MDMGYGHQRTAYPLRSFTFWGKVTNANNYQGISKRDRWLWEAARSFYEFISQFKGVPIIGNAGFSFLERFQKILSFYPKRDLSKPNFSLKLIYYFLKRGWGEDLISQLGENPIPLISTFFTPIFMAEVFNYPNDIYCVICDADIARTWVALDPAKSRIKYFAPNSWVVSRLKLYGVKEENIFFTGYPLPPENIGGEKMEILKSDISHRLANLDPKGIYRREYKPMIERHIGDLPHKPDHSLTIMFSMGGAGAQKEIVARYIKSLAPKIKSGEIKVVLAAGIRKDIHEYFLETIKYLGLAEFLNKNIELVFALSVTDYFGEFNRKLRKTDILWTKPSELSFYTALGLPIIIAPPIGAQEEYNRRWLLRLGSGMDQEDPDYADQWFFDFLESGRFADAAMQGFVEAEKLGTYNIQKIISKS